MDNKYTKYDMDNIINAWLIISDSKKTNLHLLCYVYTVFTGVHNGLWLMHCNLSLKEWSYAAAPVGSSAGKMHLKYNDKLRFWNIHVYR